MFHPTGEPLVLPGTSRGHPQRGLITDRETALLRTQLRLADAIRVALAGDVPLDLPLPRTEASEARAVAAVRKHLDKVLPEGMTADVFEKRVLNEVFGYGPLEALLAHDGINEIMVNGPWVVFAEVQGKMKETGHKFLNDEHVERIVNRIVKPLGRPADANSPIVDARLPDGSRVNALVRPCSVHGPSITIRRFLRDMMTMDQLVRIGTLSQPMADFLKAVVECRYNVIVSGGTGSGKTTLVNALSQWAGEDERVVTVEDASELQLKQRNVVQIESKLPTAHHPSRVTIRDGVVNALRMRPDRIVVGEVRGGEALDMLQAMNTGHDGSMTTLHANSPRDCISRLETCVLMSGIDLPVKAIRAQVVSAVGYIVHTTRTAAGARKVEVITEVCRMEGDVVITNDIFTLDDKGRHVATGNRPSRSQKFDQRGVKFGPRFFTN